MDIQNNEALSRFETVVEGHTPFLTYKQKGSSLALLHADVPAELEGRGVGSSLVRAALEYARERGLIVLPYCPFVASYIKSHPEYAVLVRAHATKPPAP
jgi:uncharacterized protein